MLQRLLLVLVAFVGIFGSSAFAEEASLPAPPSTWVKDEASFLSAPVRAAIDARLAAYERATGHQVVVWIGSTLGTTPLEEFVVDVFGAWKIGRKGEDDGLLVAVLSDDRRVAIEVGYGLEGQVPDAVASRIIDEVMVPSLRAGDADAALTAGVDALLEAIEGKPFVSKPGAPTGDGEPLSTGELLLYLLLAAGFLVLLVTNPTLALTLLYVMAGRGGGGGGGGFAGGGGRSGGGGARGSW